MFKSQSHVARLSTRQNAHGPLFVSTLLFGIGVALAAPGNLDPGFGDDGLVRLQIGDLGADAFTVLQQTDGKLVLVGTGNADGDFDHDFLAVRLNGNGAPDPAFSTDGIASADRAGGEDFALAAVQQPDGKLVLAGYAHAGNQGSDVALARFNANGTLDSSFGDSGWVTLDLGGDSEAATGLIQQPGGDLVIAGYSNSPGSHRTVFARFSPDGLLDSTFGSGGTTWIDVGDGSENWANDLAQQQDGKLVAGGAVYGPGLRFDMGIVRVTANGIPDVSFDGDGLLFVDFDDLGEQARSVAIQPDGAIVAAGYTVPVSDGYFKLALLRVRGDGSLDGTFGTGGRSVIDLGTQADLSSIVVQTDGKLAATGSLLTPYFYPDTILARFEANGALDTNFGNGGVAIADFGEGENGPWSIGLDLIQQADGKLLATASVPANFVAAVRFEDDASYPGRIGLTNTLESVIEETTTSVTYTVRRTGGRTGPVSVNYATVAGSAQAGSDFVAASGTLTWNAGDVDDKTITIDMNDDPDPEGNESFLLSLTSPTGGAVLAASAATTFIQNADGPGNLSFDPLRNFMSRTEGESNIQVVVGRINGSEGEVSVSYDIINRSATLGEDFVVSGTLAWADGDTAPKFIDVDYLEDAVFEGTESFQIALTAPTGGATSSSRRQTMIISDNDEGFRLRANAASVNENAGSLQILVERSGASNRAASVDYSTANGTAVAGSDYSAASGTLTWAAGDLASIKTIEIPITNDQDDENDESFTFSLSNPTGGLALAPNSTASVTIVDNDPTGGGGGGGATGLELLALLALLNAFSFRRNQIRSCGYLSTEAAGIAASCALRFELAECWPRNSCGESPLATSSHRKQRAAPDR